MESITVHSCGRGTWTRGLCSLRDSSQSLSLRPRLGRVGLSCPCSRVSTLTRKPLICDCVRSNFTLKYEQARRLSRLSNAMRGSGFLITALAVVRDESLLTTEYKLPSVLPIFKVEYAEASTSYLVPLTQAPSTPQDLSLSLSAAPAHGWLRCAPCKARPRALPQLPRVHRAL